MSTMRNEAALRHEIQLHDEIKELRRQVRLRDAALAECHKEIFKLRDALLAMPLASPARTDEKVEGEG